MLVRIGETIVQSEAILMVKKLTQPKVDRDTGKECTHVVKMREEEKDDFTPDLFVNESDLEELNQLVREGLV